MGSEKWLQVSAGEYHTCGTTATFKLWCWGDDKYKRVSGMPAAKCTVRISTEIDRKYGKSCLSSGSEKWLQVSAGWQHTCAVSSTQELACWGKNSQDQIIVPDD